MSLPYFPMYPTDFEAKTSHLTLEEDGAYNRLLRLCWMSPNCSVPDDDAWIMRRLRCDEATYLRVVKVVIEEFFTRKNGYVFSKRLSKEWVIANEAHKKRKNAGKKGGNSKALKTKENRSSNAVAMLKQCSSNQNQNQNHILEIDKSISCPFSDFWSVWPNKVSKQNAEKAWRKLSNEERQVVIELVPSWFENWRQQNPQASPIHAATFLNGKRWKDAPPQLTKISGGRNDSADENSRLQQIITAAARGTSDQNWA